MKKWLKNLLGDLLDFVVSKIAPVAIALAVLSLLIFLKDYDARIDKWCNGDWDRYGLIFFAVIPSVILLLNLLVDDWDEMPAWLWLGCYASVGLTALFIAFIPLLMAGLVSIPIFSGIVSALGIRLNALSMENGQINRTATIPQSNTLTHLGAFFSTSLSINTARTSQLAEILMLMIFKKSSFIAILLS